MKKIFLIAAAILALAVSANAQRKNVVYATLGVTSKVDGVFASFAHPGADAAFGFRNYNQGAFVSFTYGAEAWASVTPVGEGVEWGVYAIPQIGVAIGPKGFKWHPYAGLMAGYNNYAARFNVGSKQGMAFDIGNHITVDLATYLPNTWQGTWLTAVNFTYRF
ncbi:MAG: hypothetical protein J5737_06285 [Bacteroidales bacterium]|nr:hypothetical protein [Bacteroidales bacterium]